MTLSPSLVTFCWPNTLRILFRVFSISSAHSVTGGSMMYRREL